jgi:perosamine synthetase
VSETIPLFLPDINDDDRAAVDRVLRSGRLGLGDSVREFEALFAARTTRPFAVATGSLGTGLRIALTACGIGPGHDVVLPAFGPVVVANAVAFTGARPIFADVDARTLNLAPQTVEPLVTERTRAIVASAQFGNPHGSDAMARLCTKFEIPLVENATDTLGCMLGREPAGRFGRIAIFGLPPSGIVVGGDAAVIVTHDDILANACRSLRDAGRPYVDAEEGLPAEVGRLHEHERFGFDSRMDELRAALAASQLRRMDRAIELRAKLAEHYVRRLGGHTELILPTLPEVCSIAWPGYVVRLGDTYLAEDRDLIIRGLHRHDIGASNPYPVAPLMPFHAVRWGHKPGDFPVAERMSARTIALPFHHALRERDIDLVCQTLELMLKRQSFRR